jgi:hypothetical protein
MCLLHLTLLFYTKREWNETLVVKDLPLRNEGKIKIWNGSLKPSLNLKATLMVSINQQMCCDRPKGG